MKTLNRFECASPIGSIDYLTDDNGLCYLDFSDNEDRLKRLLGHRYKSFEFTHGKDLFAVGKALGNYFSGDWKSFANIPLETGGTDFQRSVWKALEEIPTGQTVSYQQLAVSVKRPKAVRAAGTANGSNPISIIIPCHRVIGKDGSLRGYAGGEWRKKWLLQHELAIPN